MRFARLIAQSMNEKNNPHPAKKSKSGDPVAERLGLRVQAPKHNKKKRKKTARALAHMDKMETKAAKNQIRRVQKKTRVALTQ